MCQFPLVEYLGIRVPEWIEHVVFRALPQPHTGVNGSKVAGRMGRCNKTYEKIASAPMLRT